MIETLAPIQESTAQPPLPSDAPPSAQSNAETEEVIDIDSRNRLAMVAQRTHIARWNIKACDLVRIWQNRNKDQKSVFSDLDMFIKAIEKATAYLRSVNDPPHTQRDWLLSTLSEGIYTKKREVLDDLSNKKLPEPPYVHSKEVQPNIPTSKRTIERTPEVEQEFQEWLAHLPPKEKYKMVRFFKAGGEVANIVLWYNFLEQKYGIPI